MPRGVYDRGKSRQHAGAGAGAAVGVAPALAMSVAVEDAAAKEAIGHISTLAAAIKHGHGKIRATVLEIGEKFYEIKKTLEGMDVEVRRGLHLPAFSTWMNTVAAEATGMSPRAAWGYYGAYAEAQAAGLTEKTITALAPTVLKTEKARRLVFIALRKEPELAQQLNDAAKNPTRLREIARSPEAQKIIARLTPTGETKGVTEKVQHYVLQVTKGTLMVPKAEFDLARANLALSEVATGVSGAMSVLHVPKSAVTVTVKALTAADVEKMYAGRAESVNVEHAEGVTLPIPTSQQELVGYLTKLIASGAAKMVHGEPAAA